MNNANTVNNSSNNEPTDDTRRRLTLAQLQEHFSKKATRKHFESTEYTVTDLSQIEDDLQRAWAQTIIQHGPHQLMWTFVFKGGHSDEFLNGSMDFIICCLNRKLAGSKSFEEKGLYLRGFYSAEQTRKGKHRGNLHYHLLTMEFPGITADTAVQRMEELLANILPRVAKDGQRVEVDVNIKLIDNEVGAAAYIAKETGFAESTKGNNMGTIEPRGLLPTGLDRFRTRLQG